MIKKILVLLMIMILVIVSATPALAQKPPQSNGKGNATHENQGNGNGASDKSGNPNAASPSVNNGIKTTSSGLNVVSTNNNSGHGFDSWGYNDTARIFNGTGMEWCLGKGLDVSWCTNYLGDSADDHLIMKWNAEWDRGNAENWANPPYDAWENNNWNGKVPGGSGAVWHYKIVWVGTCVEGADLPNGGYCIWGQFEVIMDHGTVDGVHEWLAHATPSGYGFYP